MSVTAIGTYDFPARDVRENFPAPLLYIGWEDHMMFCAPFCLPLPAEMPFGAMVENVLPGAFGDHPDFERIDWSQVQWFKSGQPWQPDFGKTLAENGLGHKDAIRFRTPGLTGIRGSSS
ncbi:MULTISPECIES: phenol hydroxylase subunit P4 [Caldimonas]|uniref:Phenol 2-monooxygenase P4 subunit n=2 Tax=Caldimonas TaxID=196013 RepID=A0AA46HVV0_9BURK|nr:MULTISPECIES: phenol hydroxylase subunit P4 [Caldimonas]TCP07102.1 phenol 2-monooxygenase P4 subunit [Caldimonas thermodepolymerans]UZD53846.1 phenol hydroxylase subunit P4 [Schlegelella aquatica]UZG46654.1 phenol hydroxylase subunit P4 [Caldimonas thermodepolymerans]